MKSTTILLVILLTFLLLLRLFFYFSEEEKYNEGDNFNVTHSFLQEARRNDFGQYFFISNVMITMPLYPRYIYGATVTIKGVVEKNVNAQGEILIVKNPEIVKIEIKNPILSIASFVRGRLDEAVIEVLPSKEAGLFLGIILGVRDRIENDFYESLRNVGVLHIIAASGQNVSILTSIILVSLARFLSRKTAIILTVGFVLLYSILAGFDPPIVRASVMAILSFGAVLLGRQSAGLFTLAITGWIMVMISPHLLTDISFQLSFLSTFGIITIKPICDFMLNFRRFLLLKEDLTTTLSAQIATFPVMLASFGTYSLLSLPVNLLLLWTIPPLMLTGALALFASTIAPILAKPFVILAYPFLLYFSTVVDILAGVNLEFNIVDIPKIMVFGYYLILIAIVIRFQKREGGKI